MTKVIKRFIAGAVCPRCGDMDSIVMFKEEEIDVRECVSCDYTDKMDFEAQEKLSSELDTRVNQVDETVREENVQVIKFMPNVQNKES
jgi:uncharacterized metal-binding protein (TIGR02443 family)